LNESFPACRMPKRKTPSDKKTRRSDGQELRKRAKKDVPDPPKGARLEVVNEVRQVCSTYSKFFVPVRARCFQALRTSILSDECMYLQAGGTIYVVGSGDCGQLGLGEDVSEKLRPGPVDLPDSSKVCFHGSAEHLMLASALISMITAWS
jgi:hypothetical protein